MWRWMAVGAALLGLSGCRCDPQAEAAYLAGSRATDCGYASLEEDRAPVTGCLDAALAAGDQAFGGWQELGRDSERREYFVVRPDRTYRLLYDGDPSGGGDAAPVITVFGCVGAPEKTASGYWCAGEALEPYTICD